jgi:hypothetical protein
VRACPPPPASLSVREHLSDICVRCPCCVCCYRQIVFSTLLEEKSTAQLFIPALIAIMLCCASILTVFFYYALPNSGLKRSSR